MSHSRRNLRRTCLVFVLLLIASTWIGHLRPVQVASNAIWDWVEARVANVDTELARKHVAVIAITEKDYAQLFRSTSPLDVDPLARLIALILHQKPQKLIVNIDTSDGRFVALPDRIASALSCLRKPEPGCECRTTADVQSTLLPIVWARAAAPPRDGDSAFELQPVLGAPDPGGETRWSAFSMLRPDDDGRVRRIKPFVPTVNGAFVSVPVAARPHMPPSAAIDIAAKWRAHEDVRLRLLPYLRQLPIIDAGEFLAHPSSLEDKTVFLGGTYASADAFLMTDGREYPGVQIVAAAALALAEDGEVIELGFLAELAIDIVLGLILVAIHHALRPAWGWLGTATLMVVLFVTASHVGYAIGFTLNLAGFLIGLGIDQSVNRSNDETIQSAARGSRDVSVRG